MILKTEAICIKNTRYGDSSVISKMFSLDEGLCSYMAQGTYRKSSQIKPSYLIPGNILELVVYQKPHANIQRIKEVKVVSQLHEVHTDMRKNAILQFILELIAKTNEEQHKDELVYYFLRETLTDLENTTDRISLFTLKFMSGYLKFSGWFPDLLQYEPGSVFNLEEGRFENEINDLASNCLSPELTALFYQIFTESKAEGPEIISSKNRKELFNALLRYYEIHVLKGRKIKSPTILAEVLA